MIVGTEYIAGFFDGEGSVGIYPNGQGESYSLAVQVCQNRNATVTELFAIMNGAYGGSAQASRTLSGNMKYNWQLSGVDALVFLKAILPHLILKKEQAEFAIAWYESRPARLRDARGRHVPTSKETRAFDSKVGILLRALKKKPLDVVMKNQEDLVEVVHTLRAVLCVKGA